MDRQSRLFSLYYLNEKYGIDLDNLSKSNINEISKQFKVSVRTIKRDIEKVKSIVI